MPHPPQGLQRHYPRHIDAGIDEIIAALDGRAITLTTQGDLVYASGANTLARLAAGTLGQLLRTEGGGADPLWDWLAEPLLETMGNKLIIFDDFWGDLIEHQWEEGGVGSIALIDSEYGGVVRIRTGATNGDTKRLWWDDRRCLHVLKEVIAEIRVQVVTATNMFMALQLYFDGDNYIAFRGTLGANWYIRCRDAGSHAGSDFDSGIAVDNNYNIFRFVTHLTGGSHVHFYINGVECANSPISTNVPDDAADFLQPRFDVETQEDVAKDFYMDYFIAVQDR